jgi:hypothetical protein
MLSIDREWVSLCQSTLDHFLTHHRRSGEVVTLSECDGSADPDTGVAQFALIISSDSARATARLTRNERQRAEILSQPGASHTVVVRIDCRRTPCGKHGAQGEVSTMQVPAGAGVRCIRCPFGVGDTVPTSDQPHGSE